MKQLSIDIEHIPFSKYGAMLSISKTQGKDELIVHDVQKHFGADDALHIIALSENTDVISTDTGLPMTVSATPANIKVNAGGGEAVFTLTGDHRIHVALRGITLALFVLSRHGYGIVKSDGTYEALCADERRNVIIRNESGTIHANGPVYDVCGSVRDVKRNVLLSPDDNTGSFDIEIGRSDTIPEPYITAEDAAAQTEKEWCEFLSKMPEVPEKHREFAEVTWYNLWSSHVRAQYPYRTDTMLMSKKFMTSVWSWDHCFNALSMAYVDDTMAINQFLAPFWLQNESGALPDMWSPNDEIVWGVTKPPIHGWCMHKLMQKIKLDTQTAEKIYNALIKWTDWWLNFRDDDGDGIPSYPQGCDSGWDNATVFDLDFFMETPDLPAYLILQMRTLSELAMQFGNETDALTWFEESQNLLEKLIEHSWDGEKFVSKHSGSHKEVNNSHCLINYIPLVLGDILPEDIAHKLVERLKKENLTEYGLATEAPCSEKYEADGYWRGPIWAPTSYLITDGLYRMGEKELARDIAERFCNMCAFSAKGNYENFDALTGKGLRAPGYTWTASVYFLMLRLSDYPD